MGTGNSASFSWQICPSTNLPAPACPLAGALPRQPSQARADYKGLPRHHAPCPTAFRLLGKKPMNVPQEHSSDGFEEKIKLAIAF
jgi:hypothetical protein